MKEGDIVRSTGQGRTKRWGNHIGTIIKVENNKVYVKWEKTCFEDEMEPNEVELVKNLNEVIKLEFSDGMIIHTHGNLRVVEFYDGWYVVGEGKLIAVQEEKSGLDLIKSLNNHNG
jgi:hypothetical protein